jgi:hypothetical protein
LSYVDLMSDVRWTEAEHVARVEAFLRSSVTHVREHVMLRRSLGFTFYLFAQLLPPGPTKDLLTPFGQPLTPAALAELTAAAQVFLQADVLAVQVRADSARLDGALDYEQAQASLTALPPTPVGAPDPAATLRAQLQAQLAAAGQDTLDLVAARKAFRAGASPEAPPP